MKINQNILINNLIYNFRKNLELLNKYQEQLSSGKKIQNSSDEPLAFHRSLYLKNTILQDEQFLKNLDDTNILLSLASRSLSNTSDILTQAKTITLQGVNDPSATGREALSYSVENLIKNLVNLANQHYDGKYIFSGDKTDASPYDDYEANSVDFQYKGDHSKKLTNTGLGFTMDTNLTGEEIFGTRYHKIISKNSATGKDVSLNKAFNTTISQGNITIQIGDIPSVTIDYINPEYDSLTKLKNAINSKRILTSAGAIVGTRTDQLSTLGVSSGTITINDGTNDYSITIDEEGTLEYLLNKISSETKTITAYLRPSDNRIILANSFDSAITVSDGTSNFASVVGLDNASNPTSTITSLQITAEIDDANKIVLTSNISDSSGNITLRDDVDNGILSNARIADENGVILGKEYASSQIFYTLAKLRDTLRGLSDSDDILSNLSNSKKENLGLVPTDIITFTAQTPIGGVQQIQLVVGTDVTSLQDLADRIQNFLRTDVNLLAQTALVRVVDGKIEIMNPRGNTSQTISELSLTATASDGTTARDKFNSVMQTITGTLSDNNSSLYSYQIYTERVSENVSALLPEIDTLSKKILALQSEIGTKIQRVEMTKKRLEENNLNMAKLLADNEDVDMAKAILEFQKQQQTYQAALGIGARIMQMTLLDFLR